MESSNIAGSRKELRGGIAVVAISDEFTAKDSQVCDLTGQASAAGNRVESTWLLPLHAADGDSPGGASALPEQPRFEQGGCVQG